MACTCTLRVPPTFRNSLIPPSGIFANDATMAAFASTRVTACKAREFCSFSSVCSFDLRSKMKPTWHGFARVAAPMTKIIAADPCLSKKSGDFKAFLASGWASPLMTNEFTGRKANFSTQFLSANEPVCSVDWLYKKLSDPRTKVLDASWHMPSEQRNPIHEYQAAHIPGALFFDIDGIADATTNLPHMLPSEEAFSAALSSLGIENEDEIIVYDSKGIYSSARVWWMLQVFGHTKVWVLDGGLPKWRSSGFDVESSASSNGIMKASAATEAVDKVYHGKSCGPITYKTTFQPHLVWSLEKVRRNIEEKTHQLIDARSKDRFDGIVSEPRKGIKSGHVPGSKCIPFFEILDSSQTLLFVDELKERFDQEGIALEKPVVTLCGTGITACVLVLGLRRLGILDAAVFDGSWTEWGAQPDTPVNKS